VPRFSVLAWPRECFGSVTHLTPEAATANTRKLADALRTRDLLGR
jgi:hypothetical protein